MGGAAAETLLAVISALARRRASHNVVVQFTGAVFLCFVDFHQHAPVPGATALRPARPNPQLHAAT